MVDTRHSFVPLFLWSTLLFLATLSVTGTQAIAQTPAAQAWREDALFRCLRAKIPGIERSIGDHTRAFDPKSGRNFAYEGEAWIDTKTLEAICPKSAAELEDALWLCLKETIPGTERSIGDHTRAFDPKSGRNFAYEGEAWIDTKTLEAICPKVPATRTATVTPPRDSGYGKKSGYGTEGPYWYASIGAEHREYFKWKEVSGGDPSVVTNDAKSSANGIGASFGYKLGGSPFYGTAGGYYVGGLETDATLSNGRSVHSDVDDYGAGMGLRFMLGPNKRFSTWSEIGAMYEWNMSSYKEHNSSGTLVLSEDRTHSSFTGQYGVGGTYWIQPRIGLDFGASYGGQFKSMNADENFRIGLGMTFRPFVPPEPLRPPAPPLPPPPPR